MCVFCECVECAVSDVYVCGVWVGVNVLVPGCVCVSVWGRVEGVSGAVR